MKKYWEKEEEEEEEEDEEEEEEEEEPAAMPTDGDDYTGVVHHFWGGPGPIDPTDVSDAPSAKMFWGGDAPIDPWDTYDGLGGRIRFLGGIDPTPPEEKIGPKFRQQG